MRGERWKKENRVKGLALIPCNVVRLLALIGVQGYVYIVISRVYMKLNARSNTKV